MEGREGKEALVTARCGLSPQPDNGSNWMGVQGVSRKFK